MPDDFDWTILAGMPEDQAEDYMVEHWGGIPLEWNNPLFRDEVLGVSGQAELNAHMDFGEQAYGKEDRLGADAAGVWYQRNIADQGHPAAREWVKRERGW